MKMLRAMSAATSERRVRTALMAGPPSPARCAAILVNPCEKQPTRPEPSGFASVEERHVGSRDSTLQNRPALAQRWRS